MAIDLNWTVNTDFYSLGTTTGETSEFVIHNAKFDGTSDSDIQQAINASIDKACALLQQNIGDSSRYLLFEWDVMSSTLTIVVTDDAKEVDAPNVVKCRFAALDQRLNPGGVGPDSDWESSVSEVADDIQYWIKDYLTTCAPFLQYSLIAAFHRESRANCALL